MFNSVKYDYNDKTKTYSFTCYLGRRFRIALGKVGYSEDKQKYLFTTLKLTGFSINRFFIPDIKYAFELLLEHGSVYSVNFKVIYKILAIINTEILVNTRRPLSIDYDAIRNNFKFQPMDNQLLAYTAYADIRAANDSRGMLLVGAIGVGKTYVSLSLSVALKSEIVLIVAPLNTIERVWVSSLSGDELLYKNKQQYYLVGTDKEYLGEKYIIVHYENLSKVIPLYKEYHINITTLIVDEVHNFNEIKSGRTKKLMDIVDTIPFKHTIPMSGTPVKAKPTDVVPLLKIVNKDFSDVVMKRFLKLYRGRSRAMLHVIKSRYAKTSVVLHKADMKLPPLHTATTKLKIPNSNTYTLEAIGKRVREYVIRRERELEDNYHYYMEVYTRLYTQVKTDLLEHNKLAMSEFIAYERNIDTILTCYKKNTLSTIPDDIREANSFERRYLEPNLSGDDKTNFREAKTIYKYIRLKVQGEALANIVMKARIDCYTELATKNGVIRNYVDSTHKKTLVFSNYISVCDAVTNQAIEAGLTPIRVYGSAAKSLSKNVGIYNTKPSVNPLVASYKSLSVGVPIVTANVIVIYGLPYRQYIFDQAIGRAWRTGQDSTVTVYIVELDTDGVPNITDRDFDIITFFRKEVHAITGSDDAVIIEKSPSLDLELHINGIYTPQESYISRLLKTSLDNLSIW